MPLFSYSFNEGIEPRFLRHLKPEFELSTNTSPEAYLIRLLTGTLRITNTLSTDTFDQNKNYTVLGCPVNSTISTRQIKECIEPESNLIKLCAHISRTKDNSTFFEALLEEFCSYFYKSAKLSYTAAFLHLYRLLEYVSYSFPLIYASLDHNYYGSFSKLKDYFDTSKNELLFFEDFTQKLLDDSMLDTPLTLNFNSLNPDVDRNHYSIIKRYLAPEALTGDSRHTSLTTSYRYLIKLTIDIRNRYFHFAMGGRRNIKGTEIIESDYFFMLLNEELANWISIIYFEILKHMCERQ